MHIRCRRLSGSLFPALAATFFFGWGSAAGAAVQDGFDTRTASLLAWISWHPEGILLEPLAVEYLLRSSAVIGVVARDVLHADAEIVLPNMYSELLGAAERADGTQTILVKLEFRVPDDGMPAKAEEFLYQSAKRLENVLNQVYDQEQRESLARLEQTQRALVEARQRAEELRARAAVLTREADAEANDPDVVRGEIMDFRQKAEQVAQEIMTRKNREGVILSLIEKLSNDARNAAGEDALLGELLQIVQIREEALARTQQLGQVAEASTSDLDDARERLAEAKARWLEAQREVMERNGLNRIADLNAMLEEQSLELVELESNREIVEKRLTELQKALEVARAYESEIRPLLPEAEEEANQLTDQLRELKAWAARIRRPTVTVIGAQD